MKILLVEDEQSLRIPVKRFLEKKNYVVDEALDGKECLELVSYNTYDCILLDLNIPEIDGVEVAKRMREEGIQTPIIMVTARSQIYDKLEGFESGADDYITKPFSLKELVARINSVIKRSSVNKKERLLFAEWELFPERNVVLNLKSSEEIELSNKEVGILQYLLRNIGNTVSAEELLEHVWDSEVDMLSDTVKTHMKTLRKKIDPKKKYISTIRGKGYLIKG